MTAIPGALPPGGGIPNPAKVEHRNGNARNGSDRLTHYQVLGLHDAATKAELRERFFL